MNKKGQVGVELMIYVFIAVIVGVILFQAIAQQVGETVNTITLTNQSIGTQTNGTPYYFTDYRSLSDVVIYGNATGTSALLTSSNYTITNNVVYNGALAVKLEPSSTEYTGTSWNISATAQPLTYIDDSGGRAMSNLIPIMFALAVMAIALGAVYRKELMDMFGR